MSLPLTFECGWRSEQQTGKFVDPDVFTTPSPHVRVRRDIARVAPAISEIIGKRERLTVECPTLVEHPWDVLIPKSLRSLPKPILDQIIVAAMVGAQDLQLAITFLTYLQGMLSRSVKSYARAFALSEHTLLAHDLNIELIAPSDQFAPREGPRTRDFLLSIQVEYLDRGGWRRIAFVGLHPRFALSQWGNLQAVAIINHTLTACVLGIPLAPGGDA
jgi:hypothetical protein